VLKRTDAVVFVVKTASDDSVTVGDETFPAKFAWPVASGSAFFWKTPFSTTFSTRPMLFMPDAFPSMIPGNERFPLTAALSHELGHTLGCEDLYNTGDMPAELLARQIDNLDIMGFDEDLAHFSLPNRMRLGWIDPQWLDVFDFGQDPNGRPVTLQAIESLKRSGPPAGRHAGIEIRLRDGWNYYFEYRRTQSGQVGDQTLIDDHGTSLLVVGTDVNPDGAAEPARPHVLLLPIDADGDGPVLNRPGEDYEETDVTNPDRMNDFRLVFGAVNPSDSNAVTVNVEFIQARRPELQITPAPGRGNWKSPDINLEGPGGTNRVAKGLQHTVVAKVQNRGNLAALAVKVKMAWLPFTTSPGNWTSLEQPPEQDIPAGDFRFFRATWDVPSSLQLEDIEVEHFCVKVDVGAYVDPLDPTHSEIVIFNNWAQSNFNSTNVPFGSPSERHVTGVAMSNKLPRTTLYRTVVEQDGRHFRTYLGNAWLRLRPGETRMVDLAYESLAGDPVHGSEFDADFGEKGFERPEHVSLTSQIVPDDPRCCHSPRIWWGAGLEVRAGRKTRIEQCEYNDKGFFGSVRFTADGHTSGVHEGTVNVVSWLAARPDEQFLVSGPVGSSGFFAMTPPADIQNAATRGEPILFEALYLGTNLYAPCRSGLRRFP